MNGFRIIMLVAMFALLSLRAPAMLWADHVSPCESFATSAGGVLLVCPAGDGPSLASIGATIDVTLMSFTSPVPGMPAGDFWIQAYVGTVPLCGGHTSSNADGMTDANGRTTISGSVAAGGYQFPVYVVAQGLFIGDPQYCDDPLSLTLVSPDINADLVVDLVDFALFGPAFGAEVVEQMDFNGDGAVDLIDFSMFGSHFLHGCSAL